MQPAMYWHESRHVGCLQYDHPWTMWFTHVTGTPCNCRFNNPRELGTTLYRSSVCHSHTRPAAAPPVEPEKVVYTDVNSEATDKTTEDSLCTRHMRKVSSSRFKCQRESSVSCLCTHPMMHGWFNSVIWVNSQVTLHCKLPQAFTGSTTKHCGLDLWCMFIHVSVQCILGIIHVCVCPSSQPVHKLE